VRAGIGALTIIDGDTVFESNLNRQLVALHSTLGKSKVERIGDSNMDNGFSSIQKCDLSFTHDFRGTRIGGTIVIDMIFILFIDFIHRIFGKNKIHWVFR
jgi:tRNA A37 threonylcarbamoyladenosine dehydratase